MREFLDYYIIRLPFEKVISDPNTLSFRKDFLEWCEANLRFPGLNPGAYCIHEYVEVWFKDKSEAAIMKLVWG